MKRRTIENDEQYAIFLQRLITGAEHLENPIITKEDYKKGRELYDAIESEILRYELDCRSRGHCIEDHFTRKAKEDDGEPQNAA